MRKTLAALALTVLPGLAAAATVAQSLTTAYTATGGAQGVMFDLTVGDGDVILTSFDLNMLQNGTVNFYIRSGGYMGAESDPSQWALQSSGAVVSAGPNLASNFDVADYRLTAGETYGIYLTDANQVSLLVSDGTAEGAVAASNDDLSVTEGTASFGFGFHFGPRTWNGAVNYTIAPVPVPAAGLLMLGALGGLAMVRRRS